jgi:hypothetical protein
MQAKQIYTSTSAGWCHLSAVYPCLRRRRRVGGEVPALSFLPERAKHFYPYPIGRHHRRR